MINSKFKLSKRDIESMGFQFVGRSTFGGEHYNFFGENRRRGPKYILNYNRKTGAATITKCLDELTIDGLISKMESIARRKTLLDYFGYIVVIGIIGLCAAGVLQEAGIVDFNKFFEK